MSKLFRNRIIGIKTETTQGTAVSLAATDFMLVEDLKLDPSFEELVRNVYRSSLDTMASIIGKKSFSVSFKAEIKGSGTLGTEYAPLSAAIQACGYVVSGGGATPYVYVPTSVAASANFYGPGKACTIIVNFDGVSHTLAGCIGDKKAIFEAGKIGFFEFTFKGIYAEPTDVTFPTQTYLTQLPAIVQSATLTLQAYAAVVNKLEVMNNNTVVERPSVNAVNGLLGFMISGRKPMGTIDPEFVPVATHNFFNKITTSAEGASSIVVGSASGNTVSFAWPKTEYVGLSYGDRNGILVVNPSLKFNQNTGDDWETITIG